MRQSAGSFAQSVRAVVIGVGAYADDQLSPLPECVKGARKVFEVLTSPAACRLAPEHVSRLIATNETTRGSIRNQLLAVGQAAGPTDTIVVYFAGHGIERDQSFFLSTSETKLNNLRDTSISADDLVEAFGPTKAKGILLICDCCGGAAIAELSPALFTAMGDHFAHRIVLSSSKRGQSSWEVAGTGSPFTTLLVDALNGKFSAFGKKGEIFFNDLFDYLSREMETLFDNELKALPVQQPVFAGSFTKDPLIFVNSEATLESIDIDTDRYSTAYVRRRVRRTLAALIAVLATVVVGLWTWLDQHRFLEIGTNGKIAVNAGYPGWKFFGFPRLVWETDIRNQDISSQSTISNSGSRVFLKNDDAIRVITDELNATGKARWLGRVGYQQEARTIAKVALKEANLSHDQALDTQEVIILTATADDTAELVKLADQGNDFRTPALKRLLKINRPAAERYMAESEKKYFSWTDVQDAVGAGCSTNLQRYVDWKFAGEWSFSSRDADFLLRTGCWPRVIRSAKINWAEIEANQATLRRLLNPIDEPALAASFDQLVDELSTYVVAHQPQGGAALELPGIYQMLDRALVSFLAFRTKPSCNPSVQALMEKGGAPDQDAIDSSLIESYLRYLLTHCAMTEAFFAVADERLQFGPLNGVRHSIDPASLDSEAINLLTKTKPETARLIAQAQLQRNLRAEEQFLFVAAAGLDDGDRTVVEKLLKTDNALIQFAAIVKLHESWKDQFHKILPSYLPELQDTAILETAAFLSSEPFLRDQVLGPILRDNRRPALQAGLRVMTGSAGAVVGELTNRQLSRREAAAGLLAFRDDLVEISRLLQSSSDPFAAFSIADVEAATEEHTRLAREMSLIAADDQGWRASIVPNRSTGGRLYLRRQLGANVELLQ